MKNNNSCYGISRIDIGSPKGGTHGWEVRIRRNYEPFEKFFNDAKYPSQWQALRAAKSYRDKIIKENPPMQRREFAQIAKRNNTSGKVGVSKVYTLCKRGHYQYVYEYWQAMWTPKPGVRKCRRFSINKYGWKRARAMAIQVREQGLSEMKEVRSKNQKVARKVG